MTRTSPAQVEEEEGALFGTTVFLQMMLYRLWHPTLFIYLSDSSRRFIFFRNHIEDLKNLISLFLVHIWLK